MSSAKKEELLTSARLFTKEPISEYHQRLNEEAGVLVMADPSLLTIPGGRGELLKLARSAVHSSGYVYKKGKSRSRLFEGPDVETSNTRKHVKISAEMRQRRIKVLEEDIESLNKQMSYKQKRLEQAEVMKRYDQCEVITKEMQELKQQKRTLENELSSYHLKEKKAQWYQQKKRTRKQFKAVNRRSSGASTSDESDFSLPSPQSRTSSILRTSRSTSLEVITDDNSSTNEPMPGADLDPPGSPSLEQEQDVLVLGEGSNQDFQPGLLTYQN